MYMITVIYISDIKQSNPRNNFRIGLIRNELTFVMDFAPKITCPKKFFRNKYIIIIVI